MGYEAQRAQENAGHAISQTRKVHSPFIDNIWGADLADMQLIGKYSKGIRFLLCVIDIFNKNAWAIPSFEILKRYYIY